MDSRSFNWSQIISAMKDESCGIPTDVTFQIVENGQLHEVKAHKMLLAMVSDTFKTMFYSTQVGDKNANVIKVEKTTAPAFTILIQAVYRAESIRQSLVGKSVDEVFDVVHLIERYQIKQLMEAAKEHLSSFPITDDTVLEVAGDAMEYSTMFETESNHLLLTCARFLKPKLKDVASVSKYAAENQHRKEEFATLMALFNDIVPTECPNCNKEICKTEDVVKDNEFREGLLVTNNRANADWGNSDRGIGRVTRVEAWMVTVESIKPGVIGEKFSGTARWFKTSNNTSKFVFCCNESTSYGD